VSQAQLENFPREPKIAEKILVSPVPLNLVKNPPIYINNRPNSIGFVGRIENDRGLDDLLIILNKLSSLNGEIEIVVAGKGKKTKYLLHELSKIIPGSRIIYLQHLEPENMSIAWSKIGVLISTAKSESYGRVMREAACYGIPVMSVLNNGAMMLSKEIPKDWIEFIDPNESPNSIATKFNKTRKQVTSSIFLQKIQIKENRSLLQKIQMQNSSFILL
jgi:glycosyltransferase involved in cell wall biosynthesis